MGGVDWVILMAAKFFHAWAKLSLKIIAVRLGAFWILILLAWTGKLNRLLVIPFSLLLLPEHSLMPDQHYWNPSSSSWLVGFSLFLCIGSAVLAAVVLMRWPRLDGRLFP